MSDNAPISVVVIDDHPLFREGVIHVLNAQDEFAVIGEGATADDAVQLSGSLLPDLILLDISMPGGGLNAVRAIASAYPVIHIVMLTSSHAEDDVLDALKSGARGYVVKGVSSRELVGILRSVSVGEAYVTPSLASSLLLEFSGARTSTQQASSPLDELTARERQILERVAAGDSNKEIAYLLGLSEKTVKHHMTNILQKLQVRNRVEAALLAQKTTRGA